MGAERPIEVPVDFVAGENTAIRAAGDLTQGMRRVEDSTARTNRALQDYDTQLRRARASVDVYGDAASRISAFAGLAGAVSPEAASAMMVVADFSDVVESVGLMGPVLKKIRGDIVGAITRISTDVGAKIVDILPPGAAAKLVTNLGLAKVGILGISAAAGGLGIAVAALGLVFATAAAAADRYRKGYEELVGWSEDETTRELELLEIRATMTAEQVEEEIASLQARRGVLEDERAFLQGMLDAAEEGTSDFARRLADAFGITTPLRERLSALDAEIKPLDIRLEALNEAMADTSLLVQERAEGENALVDGARETIAAHARYAHDLRTMTVDAVDEHIASLQEQQHAIEAVLPSLKEFAAEDEAVAEEVDALIAELSRLREEETQYSDVVRKAALARQQAQETEQANKETLEESTRAKQEAFEAQQQAWARAVDAYVNFRRQLEAVDERVAAERLRAAETLQRAVQQATARHAEAIADIEAQALKDRRDALADAAEEERKLRRRQRLEDLQALSNHLASLHELAVARDVAGFISERNRFRQERQDTREQRALEATERDEDLRQELARIAAAREERLAAQQETLDQELARLQENYDERLKQIDHAAAEERRRRQQALAEQLADLEQNLLGEQTTRQKYYAAMEADLVGYLDTYKGKLRDLWASALPSTGGFGGAAVPRATTKVLQTPRAAGGGITVVQHNTVGDVATMTKVKQMGRTLQKTLWDEQRRRWQRLAV